MLKSLHFPICGLLALSVLLSSAPVSQAVSTKSLLRKIYRNSSEGDGGDIYKIIRDALEDDSEEGGDFVNKIMANLEDNRDQLDDGVSSADLRKIKKRLKKFLSRRVIRGPINRPETST